jgi:hypothetical protein
VGALLDHEAVLTDSLTDDQRTALTAALKVLTTAALAQQRAVGDPRPHGRDDTARPITPE